jgi:hypothetical protein
MLAPVSMMKLSGFPTPSSTTELLQNPLDVERIGTS